MHTVAIWVEAGDVAVGRGVILACHVGASIPAAGKSPKVAGNLIVWA